MKTVTLKHFARPVQHRKVRQVVFRNTPDGGFDLGFLPQAEFIYHFDIAPDVTFEGFCISEVYHEPYRTFLRLFEAEGVVVRSHGSKLLVRAMSESK